MVKSDIIYLTHIDNCLDQILEYTRDLSESEFQESQLIKDAVIRNFEIIGEASKKISGSTRKRHSAIEWKKMAGMRDKLIHDYFDIDYQIVWNTVVNVIPDLKVKINQIIEGSIT